MKVSTSNVSLRERTELANVRREQSPGYERTSRALLGRSSPLSNNILDQSIQKISPILDININIREQRAQAVEDGVEVVQDGAARHLGDVVEGLAGVVADAGLRVIEAVEDGGEEDVEVEARVLACALWCACYGVRGGARRGRCPRRYSSHWSSRSRRLLTHTLTCIRPIAVAAMPMRPPFLWLALVDVEKSRERTPITDLIWSVCLFSEGVSLLVLLVWLWRLGCRLCPPLLCPLTSR